MGRHYYRAIVLTLFLVLPGCITVAQKAYENRTTEQQVTDTKIAASILKYLTDQKTTLPLDVKGDVWDGRVMLTGTVDNAALKSQIESYVRSDKRVRQVYNHIQVLPEKVVEERRREAEKSQSGGEPKEEDANDFWVSTKIKAELLTTGGIKSVNYRWSSVQNQVYVIGVARSQAERDKVLQTIRGVKGVKDVTQHIEVRPE